MTRSLNSLLPCPLARTNSGELKKEWKCLVLQLPQEGVNDDYTYL